MYIKIETQVKWEHAGVRKRRVYIKAAGRYSPQADWLRRGELFKLRCEKINRKTSIMYLEASEISGIGEGKARSCLRALRMWSLRARTVSRRHVTSEIGGRGKWA